MNSKGSCLCGAITFSVAGLSGKIYQCHCSLCRKQGGSASNTGTIVPVSQLQWLSGEEHIKCWRKDTGFKSCFCNNCGAPVPNQLRGMDYYWVPVGALDDGTLDDGAFTMAASIYLDHKASWGVVAPEGEQFATMPEEMAFIELLGNKH